MGHWEWYIVIVFMRPNLPSSVNVSSVKATLKLDLSGHVHVQSPVCLSWQVLRGLGFHSNVSSGYFDRDCN